MNIFYGYHIQHFNIRRYQRQFLTHKSTWYHPLLKGFTPSIYFTICFVNFLWSPCYSKHIESEPIVIHRCSHFHCLLENFSAKKNRILIKKKKYECKCTWETIQHDTSDKELRFYCYSAFYTHNRVFNNEQNSHPNFVKDSEIRSCITHGEGHKRG